MTAVPARFPYRLMRGVLIGAGVLYCSLLLELMAGYPLDVHTSFLSELGALDQKTSLYARALDLGSAVLLLLAAILGRPAARMHRDIAGLLISSAVFGAGTLSDALLPLSCAPSVSQACRDAAAGHSSTAFLLHEITSSIAWFGSVSLGVFAILVLRRSGWGGFWGKVVAGLAAGAIFTQVWLMIVMSFEVLTGGDLHQPGILQRVSVGLVCLMLATLLPGLRQAFTR
ncbi:DUF998 domain-containing protein [Kribbella sp. NPDC023855]|uniref:DUF998 domain-containing protein n=1 Tax=Kribbella sp. NPDC023855 TaxID=3154698 RepID=UPI00340BAEB6